MPLIIRRATPSLSLCMIAKNEELHLADCLASVQGVVDEIVLVDTGSTDATVAIAERFGARVVHAPWTGDFSVARNVSLDHARGEWILVLDADERLAPDSAALLDRLLAAEDVAGYSIICESLVGSEADGQIQRSPVFRLFRNRPDIRFEGMIHEQAAASARRTGLRTCASEVRFKHLGYLSSEIAARDKRQRNLAILEQQAAREPENPFVFFNLGEVLKLLERHDEAETTYGRSLTLLKASQASLAIPYYSNLYFSLGDLYRDRGKVSQAHALLAEGIALYPDYPDLRYARGYTYFAEGRYAEAIAEFEQCLALDGRRHAHATDPGVSGHKALTAIADCCIRSGDRARARVFTERAIAASPRPSAQLHTNLGILLVEDGAHDEALASFRAAVETDPREIRAWLNLGSLLGELRRPVEAAEAWQRACELDPGLPGGRLLLAEALLGAGRVPAALPVLDAELAKSPTLAAWRLKGMASLLAGDWTAAQEAWGRGGNDGECLALVWLLACLGEAEAPSLRPDDTSLVRAWIRFIELALAAEATPLLQRILDALDVLGVLPGFELALGRLFLARGLAELAVAALMRAQQRAPLDPAVYDALGAAYQAAGQPIEARAMRERVLELDQASIRRG